MTLPAPGGSTTTTSVCDVVWQGWSADALFRGPGAAIVKSAMLLPVSAQPSWLRKSAVVLLRDPVGLVSEQLAAP